MSELKKIIQAYNDTDFNQQKAALATVVKVTGSSYRSPGARMYISDDGRWTGSISGGCLEGDALRQARKIMQDGIPRVVTYDTHDEHNNFGIGLGCNGIIHVLLEPITQPYDPIDDLIEAAKQDDMIAMATICSSDTKESNQLGQRLIINAAGDYIRTINNTELEQVIYDDLKLKFNDRMSAFKAYQTQNGQFEVFLEVIEPPINLIIFGGGIDAQPVVSFARQIGWDVTVSDECPAHLIPKHFPQADLVACQRNSIPDKLLVKPYSAAVLMAHNFNYEYEVMKQLIRTDIRYIGILGPSKKFNQILDKLSNDGFALDPDDLHRIHAPIGVDIGADNPEEIAIAIVAEVKAKFAGRSGGFLKYRNRPIHDKDPKSGEVFKQVYLRKEELKKINRG